MNNSVIRTRKNNNESFSKNISLKPKKTLNIEKASRKIKLESRIESNKFNNNMLLKKKKFNCTLL